MYIQKLEDIANASAERVGGKAANLAQMIVQGLPVPPGFVINTSAYADHLGILSPANYLKEAKLMREALMASTISEALEGEILSNHHSLQAKKEAPLLCQGREPDPYGQGLLGLFMVGRCLLLQELTGYGPFQRQNGCHYSGNGPLRRFWNYLYQRSGKR